MLQRWPVSATRCTFERETLENDHAVPNEPSLELASSKQRPGFPLTPRSFPPLSANIIISSKMIGIAKKDT